jgi:soluble lytic murein transglycosylase
LAVLALATLAIILAVVLTPFARRAINDLTLPLSYAGTIRTQAAAKHLDPALVAAVIYAESKFDPRTSPAGAEGLMQLMPQTAKFLARRSGGISFHVSDLGKPRVNIAYGTYLLRYLIDHYGGNVRHHQCGPLGGAGAGAWPPAHDRADPLCRDQTVRGEGA